MKLKKTETDDAVSPVVGVMLMLVVTIVIAALVAAFASGLGSETSATPNALFSVEYEAITDYPQTAIITWNHKGGDTLDPNGFNLVFEEYGMVRTYSLSDGTNAITIMPNGGVSTGSKIIFNGTATNDLMYGQTTWSFIDKNTGNKIATGSLYIS